MFGAFLVVGQPGLQLGQRLGKLEKGMYSIQRRLPVVGGQTPIRILFSTCWKMRRSAGSPVP